MGATLELSLLTSPRTNAAPLLQVYSSEVKKTEILMENFRRAIGLRIKEMKEVYEGEVTELTPVETESALGGHARLPQGICPHSDGRDCVACFCKRIQRMFLCE